jgi:hypothetical protein
MSFRWFGSAVKKAELIATVQLRLRLSVPAHDFFMGPTINLIVKCAILFLFIQSASVLAAEDLKVYAGPLIGEDLAFPSAPRTDFEGRSVMFDWCQYPK